MRMKTHSNARDWKGDKFGNQSVGTWRNEE